FLWADNTSDNLEAAKLYARIAEEPQMQRLRPKALYNAFLRYKEAKKRPEALATAIKLEQAAPNSTEVREVAGIRASYYQEAGDFVRALTHYETFIKSPPKDTPPDAITQARLAAALISENLDRAGAAIQLYNSVVASL